VHGPERLPAEAWADLLLDDGSAAELVRPAAVHDPLGWPGYAERQAALGRDSVRAWLGRCGGSPLVLLAFDFAVLGGSMGTGAGRLLREGYDRARALALPVVLVTCTGGARMQEGMRALVQMPGVLAAAADHADAGLLQVGVAAHPTTGGVYASALSAADVLVAEPAAYIAFAGPRVAAALGDAASLARQGTGSAGELAIAGQVDAVVAREDLRGWLARALAVVAPDRPGGADDPVLEAVVEGVGAAAPFDGPAWTAVGASRDPARPAADAVIDGLDGVVPLVGDRAGGADPHTAVLLARLDGRRLLVVAQDHGAVAPAGFRTAQRGLVLAERLGIPVVTLIDTTGAAVGAAADDAGQAGAIAGTIRAMLSLRVPTLAVVVGEGGSGGAIALAATDRLLVQRTATFSVIAPEGAAAILHRDPGRAPEVADRLGLRSADLLALGIADGVVRDDAGGTLAAVAVWLADPPPADVAARRTRWRRIADGTAPPPPHPSDPASPSPPTADL
jgi:acetyl-CoA carboxylase beta subunit